MASAVATKKRPAKGDGREFERKAAKLGELIADGRKQADELSAVGTAEARERARLIRWHATRDENSIVALREYLAEHPDD
jgi:hypothetical protein